MSEIGYDMAGQHVRTIEPQNGGGDEARWDARNKKDEEVASGTYIFMIQSDSASYVGKVVILR
jgi:flagellar hook assembly protein FlgD